MNADFEEQEDELLALQSIFGSEEFIRKESKTAGEIRVSVDLPTDFTVSLKEGETRRQYDILFLPPLYLTFELPVNYPSSAPPSFTLTCSWLTHAQLSALSAQLTDLYQASPGAVVLFTWVQFLKEDALRFLDIHTRLELLSDVQNTQSSVQASLSEPNNNENTQESGPTEHQTSNISNPYEPDFSMPSSELLNEDQEIIASQQSISHSQRAAASDSYKDHRNNSAKVRQVGPSGPIKDYQGTRHDSYQILQASDGRKAAAVDLSLAAGLSIQSSQGDFFNEGSSSGSLEKNKQGDASLPIYPRESPLNEDQSISGLSPTPSQSLLSQLLIYDVTQQQRQFATTVFDCGVCYMGLLGSDCMRLLECGHTFCRACLAEFCKLQITEGNVRGVTCPQSDCRASPTPAQVKSLVGEELFSRYDRLLLQNTLDRMPDVVYCPRRSCGSAVIQDTSSAAAMCPACSFAFCVTCKKTFHGTNVCQTKRNVLQTNKDAQQDNIGLPQSEEGLRALWDDYAIASGQRRLLLEGRYGRKVMRATVGESLNEVWISSNSKNCPHCFCKIEKNEGCNIMACTKCGGAFCWECLAKLSHKGEHYQDGACSF